MNDTHDRNLEILKGPEGLVDSRVREIEFGVADIKAAAIASGAEFGVPVTEAASNFERQVEQINPANNPLMTQTPPSPEVARHTEDRRTEEARQAIDAAFWN